jgi:hypothetical protein
MEYDKKGGFIKVGLNIVVDEILSEIRNDILLMVFSKIGILKIGMVIVVLI